MIHYILDTDTLSLSQRRHPVVTARIRSTPVAEVAITIITAEEQLRGRFLQIRQFPSGLACVDAYRRLSETIDAFETLTILDFDAASETIDQLLRKQKPQFPTQDRRIAAIALANNCILVTRNQNHFGQVPNLTLEDWTK